MVCLHAIWLLAEIYVTQFGQKVRDVRNQPKLSNKFILSFCRYGALNILVFEGARRNCRPYLDIHELN